MKTIMNQFIQPHVIVNPASDRTRLRGWKDAHAAFLKVVSEDPTLKPYNEWKVPSYSSFLSHARHINNDDNDDDNDDDDDDDDDDNDTPKRDSTSTSKSSHGGSVRLSAAEAATVVPVPVSMNSMPTSSNGDLGTIHPPRRDAEPVTKAVTTEAAGSAAPVAPNAPMVAAAQLRALEATLFEIELVVQIASTIIRDSIMAALCPWSAEAQAACPTRASITMMCNLALHASHVTMIAESFCLGIEASSRGDAIRYFRNALGMCCGLSVAQHMHSSAGGDYISQMADVMWCASTLVKNPTRDKWCILYHILRRLDGCIDASLVPHCIRPVFACIITATSLGVTPIKSEASRLLVYNFMALNRLDRCARLLGQQFNRLPVLYD